MCQNHTCNALSAYLHYQTIPWFHILLYTVYRLCRFVDEAIHSRATVRETLSHAIQFDCHTLVMHGFTSHNVSEFFGSFRDDVDSICHFLEWKMYLLNPWMSLIRLFRTPSIAGSIKQTPDAVMLIILDAMTISELPTK